MKLAQDGIKTNIEKLFADGEDYIERFIGCLNLLRVSCIRLRSPNTYNGWFQNFIVKNSAMTTSIADNISHATCQRIHEENLSLISDMEIIGGVTEEENNEFMNKHLPLKNTNNVLSVQMTVNDADDDDDDDDMDIE